MVEELRCRGSTGIEDRDGDLSSGGWKCSGGGGAVTIADLSWWSGGAKSIYSEKPQLIDQRRLAFGQAIAARITEDREGFDHCQGEYRPLACHLFTRGPQARCSMEGGARRAGWQACSNMTKRGPCSAPPSRASDCPTTRGQHAIRLAASLRAQRGNGVPGPRPANIQQQRDHRKGTQSPAVPTRSWRRNGPKDIGALAARFGHKAVETHVSTRNKQRNVVLSNIPHPRRASISAISWRGGDDHRPGSAPPAAHWSNWAAPVPGGISTTRLSSAPPLDLPRICFTHTITIGRAKSIGVSSSTESRRHAGSPRHCAGSSSRAHAGLRFNPILRGRLGP